MVHLAVWWAAEIMGECVQGDSFPSRVGASLARAVEMEDMIAYNLTEYEDKAVELGLNEQKRLEVRQRLARKRLEAPLFDTARWVTSFEESLETIWQRHQDHLPPRDIFPTDPGVMHSVRACDPQSDRCVCVAHAHFLWCSSLDGNAPETRLRLVAKSRCVRTR